MSFNLQTNSTTGAASGLASMGADVIDTALQDNDPTDRGSVGKAALGGAAKGAAAGLAFGPLGAAIGGGIGAIGGLVKGGKAKKEGLEEQKIQKAAANKAAADSFKSERAAARAEKEQQLTWNTGQNPKTNGTGGGNSTFSPQAAATMSAVSDPKLDTYGSLFSKPVSPPMDDI